MNFRDLLNDFCRKLNCSQNDLTSGSGLSAPVISRYLSGERTPSIDSEQIQSLARRLSDIASEKEMTSDEYSYESILSQLNNSLRRKEQQYAAFISNFNALIDHYNIKIKDLAKGINFDASFLYRIRSGERHPSNLNSFCQMVSSYIAEMYASQDDIKGAASLLKCESIDLSTKESYSQHVLQFLLSEFAKPLKQDIDLTGFLCKMNEFNLDEYIEAIHFNDIKIPTSPIHLPISKYYYGISEMRKAELVFFKSTVLSKSTEDVFMYGDMPMNDMAEDMNFNKKWMFAIAATLKKGLNINIIHNLDRPGDEIIMGLEAWIPIYMTGQVCPYHLEGYSNTVFHQLNYCSGSAALFGECIENYHNEGRYYLSTNKHDIAYYRTKANSMLKHAKPLMDIYNVSKEQKFISFIKTSMAEINATRHVIGACLPIYTMPDSLLNNIISTLPSDLQVKIRDYYITVKELTMKMLEHNSIIYDYHILTKDEFERQPQYISFPELFISSVREYTYEEYLCHVKATLDYSRHNTGFILNNTSEVTFKNIQITIVQDNYFIVSKFNSPNIHFVIRHSKMLSGIENFYAIKKE